MKELENLHQVDASPPAGRRDDTEYSRSVTAGTLADVGYDTLAVTLFTFEFGIQVSQGGRQIESVCWIFDNAPS